MAIAKSPVSPAPWPPGPRPNEKNNEVPYRLKCKYTVKPGESFASIARQEGIDVWALILFNFRTTDAMKVNWYLQKYLKCTKETRDRKNYTFSGGEEIYIPEGVSPSSCSPWPNRSKWDISEVTNYQRWILENGEDYVGKKGYTRDCANFAVDALVDFVKTRQLPVAFYSAAHKIHKVNRYEGWSCTSFLTDHELVRLPEYNWQFTLPVDHPDYESFAKSARFYVKASDLYDLTLGNTIRIAQNELQPGDLLILPPPNTLHVQVVLSPLAYITVDHKPRTVLMILQGNMRDGDWRGSSAGEPIVLKAWDLTDYKKYYVNVDGTWKDDPQGQVKLNNFHCRQWNFDMFNMANGISSPSWLRRWPTAK
ncbi:MAG: LysM peptidoglycan-binding domain-containing protein [Candidatus Sulfotelmatobacter sp.]